MNINCIISSAGQNEPLTSCEGKQQFSTEKFGTNPLQQVVFSRILLRNLPTRVDLARWGKKEWDWAVENSTMSYPCPLCWMIPSAEATQSTHHSSWLCIIILLLSSSSKFTWYGSLFFTFRFFPFTSLICIIVSCCFCIHDMTIILDLL